MALFKKEPQRTLTQKVGVLLMNLGTPERPETSAVKPYLQEFLSDKRVVELPTAIWQPILRGAILTRRPKASAQNYQKVWTKQGSPLAVILQAQTQAVQAYFQAKKLDVTVDYVMTYGQPNIATQIENFKQQGIGRILILPLYPQYSGSATGAALDKLYADLMKQRNMPSIRTVRSYGEHAGYISAMSQHLRQRLPDLHTYERILFSYHGVPQNHIDAGDPYQAECLQTSHLLAKHLGLDDEHCITAFQSRFGRAKWVEPSTQNLLDTLPKQGVKKIAVFCPGFSADCLETLEEIAIAGKEQFEAAGGIEYTYVPCLNTEPAWIESLCSMISNELMGWI